MEFSFCLYWDFDDFPILQYIVLLHHLPIVHGLAPHAGIFHVFKKILVDPACRVSSQRALCGQPLYLVLSCRPADYPGWRLGSGLSAWARHSPG